MSGADDLARLKQTIDTTNELFLSEEIKMVDVGGGVQRPTNAKVLADLSTQMSGALIYTSTALGLAGTVSGGYFSVISADAKGYVDLYRNDSGVATPIDTVPNSAAVNEIADRVKEFTSDVVSHEFRAGKFILAQLMLDGALQLLGGKLRSDGLKVTDLLGSSMATFGVQQSDINGLVLRKSNSQGIEFVDKKGFIIPGAEGQFTGATPVTKPSADLLLALNHQLRTDHIAIINYGQSLSRGAKSLPVLSVTQLYSNLMLASGTKTRATESGFNASSYVPLVEAAVLEDGETPVTAMCNGAVRRAVASGESASNWVFVGASPGQGGQTVEALGPGGVGYFEKTIELIKSQAALSAALGKSYSVWAYAWEQGEANYPVSSPGTRSAYQYTQLYLDLFDKMSVQISQITGQKFLPYIFTYQVAAHRKYSSDTMQIALAQWRASRQRADVVMSVPAYILPVVTEDNLHLTNEASWLMGEYHSRSMYETMIRRSGKWRPLEPVAVTWADDHIDIKFHVPRGRLVLDTALAAAAANQGFDIRESDAVVTSLISGVAVSAEDTVRISLSRPASTDAVLTYARGRIGDPTASGPMIGARGNLRDTHGLYDTATSPSGAVYALHNPCVMFEYSRQSGF